MEVNLEMFENIKPHDSPIVNKFDSECPFCGELKCAKWGLDRKRNQRYRCNECGYKFVLNSAQFNNIKKAFENGYNQGLSDAVERKTEGEK